VAVYREAVRARWGWLLGIVLVTTVGFVADSALRPRFVTEASILIPPHDEWGGIEALARNIVTNERFLSTQVAVLASDTVLSDAWRRAHAGVPPTDEERRTLRGAITTLREPFNNLVTVRLLLPRPDLVAGLLAAFEAHFRASALAVASQRRAALRSATAEAETRVAAVEAELASLRVRGGNGSAGAPTPGDAASRDAASEAAREARRVVLRAELEAAIVTREKATAELREVTWRLERPGRFIQVVSGPTPSRRTNEPITSAVRGLLAGLLLDLLVVYGLVVLRPALRGR
jgi:uncharacterized protein involved in exopolysaccharide biosynthesis